MLIDFFFHLRQYKVPVSVNELLTLHEALKQDVIGPSMDEFYVLARTTMVKDQAHFDKFDRAFGGYFNGIQAAIAAQKDIPLDWLMAQFKKELSPEELAKLQTMDYDTLLKTLQERLKEQKERHEGGNRWVGTGGTSPFGNNGVNPQGIRIGGQSSGGRSAVKVWDMRNFRDYDDSVELGTRNIKVALRRLRRFAREGAQQELDLDDTIGSTARNAGYLDIKMVPERHNSIKVLMLLDVGGTMDDHISRVEELFSAARSQFKNMEVYYFHNCVYDFLWKSNNRRHAERFATWDVLRKYNPDYRLIFVGDATMSPYEVLQPGGSVEYNNEEAGAVWLQRFISAFPKFAWLNPEPEGIWRYRQSISVIQQIMANRMYPVTLKGLEQAMRTLSK